jgi:hypothetical protein
MVYSVPDDLRDNFVITQVNFFTRYSALLMESTAYMVDVLYASAPCSNAKKILDSVWTFMNGCLEDLTSSEEDLKKLLNSDFNMNKIAKKVELNLEILKYLHIAIDIFLLGFANGDSELALGSYKELALKANNLLGDLHKLDKF